MYKITKRFELSCGHQLNLPYESKCNNLHGHNYIVDVTVKAKRLNPNGMVLDFTAIKKYIVDELDHRYLNDILGNNPTAERIAEWIVITLGEICYEDEGNYTNDGVYKITCSVQESEGNTAYYSEEF